MTTSLLDEFILTLSCPGSGGMGSGGMGSGGMGYGQGVKAGVIHAHGHIGSNQKSTCVIT